MIELPDGASMADFQHYINELEQEKGWLGVDLVHNCFFLGEEMGELFKAVRRHQKLFEAGTTADESRAEVAEELVDVFNYLLAIANRLDIDLEAAFRRKNAVNQSRTWP